VHIYDKAAGQSKALPSVVGILKRAKEKEHFI